MQARGLLQPLATDGYGYAWNAGAHLQDADSPHSRSIATQEGATLLHRVRVRYVVIPDRVEIDASMGDQPGPHRAMRWWTIGLRVSTRPFI